MKEVNPKETTRAFETWLNAPRTNNKKRIVVFTGAGVSADSGIATFRDENVPIYLVDPGTPNTSIIENPFTHIKERGAIGVPILVEKLHKEWNL